MTTTDNYETRLIPIVESLKKLCKNDAVLENLINQIKDKPETLERASNTHLKYTVLPFSFQYPEHRTKQWKERLLRKAIKERIGNNNL